MTHTISGTDRRGEGVAAAGLFISLAGFAVFALLGFTYNSLSIYAAGWLLLGGAGVWLLNLIQLHQLRLVEQERFEIGELERDRRERLGGVKSVFDEEDAGQMESLAMVRRLRSIERWFVPIFAMGLAACLALIGFRLFPEGWPFELVRDSVDRPVGSASMLAFFAGAVAFITFALSRYAIGMSRLRGPSGWTMLRAGGGYFFGVSVACLATAVALVLAHNGYPWLERWLSRALGVGMMVIAGEMVLNFVFDLYRPRVTGQLQRVFYESRLLGLFSEPEGIIRSAAHAIDYQFGFKVSDTWFYQFLQRNVLPLILFQGAILLLMSCFVVVPQGHKGVVERLLPGSSDRWVADAGVGFTWPWPLARVTLIPVDRVQRLELGYEATDVERHAGDAGGPILWTEAHRDKEYQLLIADRRVAGDTQAPVNLLSVAMPVHWRVKRDHVIDFHRQSSDIESVIESVAYQQLTHYAAHADLLDLMGKQGIEAIETLRRSMQQACDTAGVGGGDLGVEITHVGLTSVHPPTEVADAYENYINAFEQHDTKIRVGTADAQATRIRSAGIRYQELYDAILAEDAARESGAADAAEKTARVEALLRAAGGTARVTAAEAEAYCFDRVTGEGARAALFRTQREAFALAPEVVALRTYLATVVNGLAPLHKYLVLVNDPSRVVYQPDIKPPPVLDVLGEEVRAFGDSGR